MIRRIEHCSSVFAGLVCIACLVCPIAAVAAPPLGLPPVSVPTDNRQTVEKIALGERLFHDTRLSADGQISCASCHKPELAFTDGLALAKGLGGQVGARNTPTILNAAYNTSQFWDGRRASLEDQARDPFLNPLEHGFSSEESVLLVVRSDDRYLRAFRKVFGVKADGIKLEHIAKAIASFERSLLSGDSPFDRYYYGGDKLALTPSAIRGLALFRGRAQCADCHTIGPDSATFTDDQFHRVNLGLDRVIAQLPALTKRVAGASSGEVDRLVISQPDIAALGRFVVTRRPSDIGRFKTPSLRNVALTAPYMHDGSAATLEDMVRIELYYRSLERNRPPLVLALDEQVDLVEFLKALTGSVRKR